MLNLQREKLIDRYITAYNNLELNGMVEVLHKDVVFENYTDGKLTTSTQGIDAFKKQAEQAIKLFESRNQSPEKWIHQTRFTEVHLDYQAVLAEDLPEKGLRKGDELKLKGKSKFEFKDGLISKIEDYA
ncbi:MAG: nuclear transport factor 2 family protein [Algoriphagus sp.]|uniref:nuclear transport factor 2 family protein n=1 Tax=Algoriphagus sp. TaxID=1872435 RepID=UPI00181595A6|nr:nuclear transport factor 2 family protein [Algoriphagus sp.]NVJ87436.1 nuclear transport factor 2 family protein [Algoriphagus sp.]